MPDDHERGVLAATFGAELARRRRERGLTQQALADAAGLRRQMVDRLEHGRRRPATVSTWRLARALRPLGSLRDRVALDEQLRRLAGESLRAATRPHAARERVRAELLAEAGDRPVAGDHYKNLGSLMVMDLGVRVREGPAVQPGRGRVGMRVSGQRVRATAGQPVHGTCARVPDVSAPPAVQAGGMVMNVPGWAGALPEPATSDGSTSWGALAADYPRTADGTAPWASAAVPTAMPPEVESVTERVGWLTRGRDGAAT